MLEIAGLLVLGILAQWLAWRIRVPAILPLILIGLAVGPLSTYITSDGQKFIDGNDIFQGDFLFDVISLSVGLILFEGGLTLKLKEVKTLGSAVTNLIIIGSLVTLIGGAVAAHLIMGMTWRFAFLFAALIIVTGPTVIGPILRNVKPNFSINTVLKWEGILIDPVGALVAILIYEFVVSGRPNEQFTFFALKGFVLTVLSGIFIGVLSAFILYNLLTKNWIPKYLRNVIVLAMVILTFSVSDMLHAESGLLAVTLLGMILANLKIDNLKEILSFKEDIVLILISLLFVLLSSMIKVSDITTVLNGASLALFCIVVFILRPISVFLSTINSDLTFKEKIFVSAICPRGIVSAAVASIFTIRLTDLLKEGSSSMMELFHAQLLLPLTFMIIVGTVVLQGIIAKPLATYLGVLRKEPNGVIFLGASEPARFIALFLKKLDIPVKLADTSKANIQEAVAARLPVFEGSLADDEAFEEIDLSRYGQLHAMTSNTEINIMSCKILSEEFGEDRVFRLASNREIIEKRHGKGLLFNGLADYINITQYFRKKPSIHGYEINSAEELNIFLKELGDSIIPLFVHYQKNKVIPVTNYNFPLPESSVLYYIIKDDETEIGESSLNKSLASQ